MNFQIDVLSITKNKFKHSFIKLLKLTNYIHCYINLLVLCNKISNTFSIFQKIYISKELMHPVKV